MSTQESPTDFVRSIIKEDLASGKHASIVTRFPPEPNGYLHVGHAKAICLDFGVAEEFGGTCHLRFDDTNPSKEEQHYADAIQADIRWLGFDWGEHLYHASDYFGQLYDWACHLIKEGNAYVDEQTAEEIRANRGDLNHPGTDSPYRDRPAEESMDLFQRMRNGEFEDGSKVLRAKIDMAHPNINLRDAVLYRVQKKSHPRTGDAWCIYPMYDFAHGQSDAIEKITHSLCTLEFENHRPLYEWFLDHLPIPARPRQYEFSRLNLSYTITSKRKLKTLVDGGHVASWDDPRMPTISGMRRRGITATSIRELCKQVGITRTEGTVDFSLLQSILRDELNDVAPRRMAVLDPIKVVVENYPAGQVEMVQAKNHPDNEAMGTREVPFGRELWIEREDFREEAPRKYFRLKPGEEVRFKYAYYLTCTGFDKDEAGNVTEIRCTYDPESRGGNTEDGRKVKGTIHWVHADTAVKAEVRLYDHLFQEEKPEASGEFLDNLNPDSLTKVTAVLEPGLANLPLGESVQFERSGYFCKDTDSSDEKLVFNRSVALRDSWAKLEKKLQAQSR
ncbi:MAG: glutamine--tRNA ligase/YqeY domain fusion protein [Planctomycetota bacterium]|nr:glutamine--tRNA ligase/YqeY domain fusion protein [Planctomycetota bacterium]MDA1114760.1 glutamine--tRNA ligase/YqeY domain fusion protein [Planctomycetota bacterium]